MVNTWLMVLKGHFINYVHSLSFSVLDEGIDSTFISAH